MTTYVAADAVLHTMIMRGINIMPLHCEDFAWRRGWNVSVAPFVPEQPCVIALDAT